MSEQDPQETPTRVTDKRGANKKPAAQMPTAQELLDQETPPPVTEGETEFQRQQREAEEDARRAAEFEAMSPEEQQEMLARQAAEAEGIPYEGGGVQTDGEARKELLTAFVIAVDLDGTAHAMPWELFEIDKVTLQRDVTPRIMYRSCAEIMMDVQVAETSHTTLQMFKTVGDQMAAAQRGQMLAQQVQQRGGMRGGKRR